MTESTLFDFDQVVERRHTQSDKWEKYAGQDILPMWVADTDFRSPPAVIEALHQRVDHGVFGYGHAPEHLTQLIIERMQTRYQWTIEADWLVYLPGLVCGLNLAARALTESAQSIMTPSPIYPPFVSSAKLAERELIKAPVTLQADNRWLMDLNQAEQSITEQTKLLQFCNPLNPGGTVYRREELEAVHAFAKKHDLLVCSDEIHSDLILSPDAKHIPFASLNEDAAQRSVTLIAPSKTFNIAGLGASIAIIPNPALRARFTRTRQGIVPSLNVLAYTAAEAAYDKGQAWLDVQLDYLRGNRDYLLREINQIEGLTLHPFDATYLAWIDASALPVANPFLFFEKAGVGMSPGSDFGNSKFVRLNFGCTRALLEEAVKRIKTAVAGLN
ncbi:Cystathionine beta-lyase PatB [Vibrio stylophorae]|uniref:cysteine-S-conjugate beta-lyase n=1 Tax=Vibrio stylophorae TaxID=659351 RepID=A0ABM8ZSB1_9VIBR|nr:PatB family C-S lyase [Vibrio stylophorae]CAH0533181.1 Cystathionine beta-lyase PatB [Vibrio stylophorae]